MVPCCEMPSLSTSVLLWSCCNSVIITADAKWRPQGAQGDCWFDVLNPPSAQEVKDSMQKRSTAGAGGTTKRPHSDSIDMLADGDAAGGQQQERPAKRQRQEPHVDVVDLLMSDSEDEQQPPPPPAAGAAGAAAAAAGGGRARPGVAAAAAAAGSNPGNHARHNPGRAAGGFGFSFRALLEGQDDDSGEQEGQDRAGSGPQDRAAGQPVDPARGGGGEGRSGGQQHARRDRRTPVRAAAAAAAAAGGAAAAEAGNRPAAAGGRAGREQQAEQEAQAELRQLLTRWQQEGVHAEEVDQPVRRRRLLPPPRAEPKIVEVIELLSDSE